MLRLCNKLEESALHELAVLRLNRFELWQAWLSAMMLPSRYDIKVAVVIARIKFGCLPPLQEWHRLNGSGSSTRC